jgi:glycosyltransferase involved in cell wall biosynthesis
MITYGHEKFIEQAINGILMQECDFEVELIIANDCSQDKTDDVIQGVLENHPRTSWVKYLKHEKNLGMMPNFIYAMQECKSRYIAMCEGDDYWADPLKLQKQVDFLEANPDYVLCFHPVSILKTNGEIVDDFITKVPENYETIETLARLGNYIHTPSVVFRNVIKEFPLEFELSPFGDYFLYMMLSEYGKLKYLEDKMAVYRYNVGVISQMSGLKIANANVKLYSCMVSYLKNEEIKKIIFDKQIQVVTSHYTSIEKELEDSIILNHLFFRAIKFIMLNYKHPEKIFKRIKKRIIEL